MYVLLIILLKTKKTALTYENILINSQNAA